MNFILLFFFTFSAFAQKQLLKKTLFPNGIVADACGVSGKSIEEFEKKFGKPQNKKSMLVPNPHDDIKNTLTTFTWSDVEAVFLTLPETKQHLGKTYLVSVKATKNLSPDQKIKLGQTKANIENVYGKLDAKLNPNSTSQIEYWVEQEMDPDYISYSLDKGYVKQIDCVNNAD